MINLKIDLKKIILLVFMFFIFGNINVFAGDGGAEQDDSNLPTINTQETSASYKFKLFGQRYNYIVSQPNPDDITASMDLVFGGTGTYSAKYPSGMLFGEPFVDYIQVDQRDIYDNLPLIKSGDVFFDRTFEYDIFTQRYYAWFKPETLSGYTKLDYTVWSGAGQNATTDYVRGSEPNSFPGMKYNPILYLHERTPNLNYEPDIRIYAPVGGLDWWINPPRTGTVSNPTLSDLHADYTLAAQREVKVSTLIYNFVPHVLGTEGLTDAQYTGANMQDSVNPETFYSKYKL